MLSAMVPYRNTQQDLFDIIIPIMSFRGTKESHFFIAFKELNKDFKTTAQLFCAVKFNYRNPILFWCSRSLASIAPKGLPLK